MKLFVIILFLLSLKLSILTLFCFTTVSKEKFLFFIRWHRNLLARSRVKNFITHPKQVAVCGHSHLVEFSPDKKYINNGVIRWGLGQYLIVEDGQLDLVRGRYD